MCTGSDPVGLGGLHFFAINGWKDMQFIYTGNQYTSVDNQGGPGTMHCKNDYKSNCLIAQNWTCDASGSVICNDPYPPTSAPTTTIPTTSIPTTNMPTTPTKIPTHSPSKFPTHSPSKIPTHSPSKIPTHSPSNIPTFSPSMNPTTNIPSTSVPTSDQLSISVPTYSPLVFINTVNILSTFNERVEEKVSHSSFWIAIYIVMFLICCCICIFCVVVMYQIRKRKYEFKENSDMELTQTNQLQHNVGDKHIKIEKRLPLQNINLKNVYSTSNMTIGGDVNGHVQNDEFIVNGDGENNDIINITNEGDMQVSKPTEGHGNDNIAEDEFIVDDMETIGANDNIIQLNTRQ